MSKLQKILLAVIALAIVALIIIFWGSIFSGAMIYALVMILPVYLYNRFLNVDRTSDYLEDDNG